MSKPSNAFQNGHSRLPNYAKSTVFLFINVKHASYTQPIWTSLKSYISRPLYNRHNLYYECDTFCPITDAGKPLSRKNNCKENSGKADPNSSRNIKCGVFLLIGVLLALGLASFSTIMIIKMNLRAEEKEKSPIVTASECFKNCKQSNLNMSSL